MKELFLSLDATTTQADASGAAEFTIALSSDGVVGETGASSQLPFWDEVGHHRTALRVAEVNRFRSKDFSEEEQDWMVSVGLLHPGRTDFCPDYLEILGHEFYKSLFPGKVAERFCCALQDVHGEELHVRLRFSPTVVRQSRLANYPWELIHDGSHFLLHRNVRLSRYLAFETAVPPLSATEQLQVWLVSSRASDKRLGLKPLPDDERQVTQASLKPTKNDASSKLTILPDGKFETLKRNLSDCPPAFLPQVLHFDGHGLYGQRCSRCGQLHNSVGGEFCTVRGCGGLLARAQGFLIFEGDAGKADAVSAQDFAGALPLENQLVVMTACESGMALSGKSLFDGAAQQLVDKPIPAVVAMQYAVRVKKASQFSKDFYLALGQGQSIIAAVSAGRLAMGREGNQWYRPTLYWRSRINDPGKILCEERFWKDSGLEELYNLLQPGQQELWPAIDNAYKSILNPLELTEPPPSKTLRQRLESFAELASNREEAKFSCVVYFVLRLLREELISFELLGQLKAWVINREPQVRQQLEKQEKQKSRVAPVNPLQSTLMLKVQPDPQERGHQIITAILTQDENHNWCDKVVPKAIALGEARTVVSNNAYSWLHEFVKVCTGQDQGEYGIALRDLAVECFLPVELLHLAVDANWTVELGDARPLSICCKSFTVRVLDRHGSGRKYELQRSGWEQAWEHLARYCEQPWNNNFVTGEGELDELLDAFIEQDGFTGWQFELPSDREDQTDLFEEILNEAVPMALWIRPDEQVGLDEAEVEQQSPPDWNWIPGDVALEQLPKALTKVRKRRSTALLGRRMVLMWDNPFRPLPDIDYQDPSLN